MEINIPNQYTPGFGRKFIPAEQRYLHEYIGQAVNIDGIVGDFKGSSISERGVTILHFDRRAFFPDNSKGRIDYGHHAIEVSNVSSIATIPTGLDKMVENYNNSNGHTKKDTKSSNIIRI